MSGVGGGGIVIAGASLVVVHKAQYSTAATPKAKVHLNGALTVAQYGGKADLFPVPVPAGVTVQSATVHLGVANGTASGYDLTRFASQRSSGRAQLTGGSGAKWDDKTYALCAQ